MSRYDAEVRRLVFQQEAHHDVSSISDAVEGSSGPEPRPERRSGAIGSPLPRTAWSILVTSLLALTRHRPYAAARSKPRFCLLLASEFGLQLRQLRVSAGGDYDLFRFDQSLAGEHLLVEIVDRAEATLRAHEHARARRCYRHCRSCATTLCHTHTLDASSHALPSTPVMHSWSEAHHAGPHTQRHHTASSWAQPIGFFPHTATSRADQQAWIVAGVLFQCAIEQPESRCRMLIGLHQPRASTQTPASKCFQLMLCLRAAKPDWQYEKQGHSSCGVTSRICTVAHAFMKQHRGKQ